MPSKHWGGVSWTFAWGTLWANLLLPGGLWWFLKDLDLFSDDSPFASPFSDMRGPGARHVGPGPFFSPFQSTPGEEGTTHNPKLEILPLNLAVSFGQSLVTSPTDDSISFPLEYYFISPLMTLFLLHELVTALL